MPLSAQALQRSGCEGTSGGTISRELPLPAVPRTCNLEQAHATLELCSGKLRARIESWAESNSGFWKGQSFASEARQFHLWLEAWERAFSALLSNAITAMDDEDVRQCRVLKANHLSCTILSSLLEDNPRANISALETDFQAIIGLAIEVLDRQASTQATKSALGQTAMSMANPLTVVQLYSSSAALRDHASKMLDRYYHNTTSTQRLMVQAYAPPSTAASSPESIRWSVSGDSNGNYTWRTHPFP